MVSTYAAPIAANQFFQGLFCRQEASHRRGQTALQLPPTALSATASLLAIVQTLCAPDSGWPADKPQIPETLLPYVADETAELLEALQGWTADSSKVATVDEPSDSARRDHPELFADLSAFLLWAIAASTPTAIKLLEGLSTQLSLQAETYGVRLVPVLRVQGEKVDYALDLATQTHFDPPRVLREEAILQLPDQDAPTLSLKQWQQKIWAGAIAIAPELLQWQRGTPMHLLLPGQTWTTARATLVLHFVPLTVAVGASAIPETEAWRGATSLNLDEMGIPNARVWQAEADECRRWVDTDIIANGTVSLAHRFSLDSDVAFEDIAGLQAAIAPLAIEQLSHRLQPSGGTAQLSLLDLVEAAYTVIHPDQSPEPLPLRSPLTLAELCQQVKWLWIRASQDLMPLMAGVAARQLASGQPWDLGTVVMVGQLVIQEGAGQALLDVTAEEWEVAAPPHEADAILHLQTPTGLPQTLWQGESLAAYCQGLVQQRSPLLAYLMSGTPVKLTSPHDALFPEIAAEPLPLRFQIAVNFLP